jgi:tRNA1(Val) A37 N6-methylase TrmN6
VKDMLADGAVVKPPPGVARMGRMLQHDEITEDAILGGRIRVRQPARGYRVNVDTLLLAAALPPEIIRCEGTRVAEVCCGVGAALLSVATRFERTGDIEFVGIERDPKLAALARENVTLNEQAYRVSILEADALDSHVDFGLFDYVFFNPPYDMDGEGRAPAAERRGSYISERPIEDWIKVWSNRMRAHAEMTLIHRAHRLPDILAALDGRLGGVEIFPIRPSRTKPARRVVVRARKGSRAPLKMFAGLDLHPEDNTHDKYTPEAEALLRGDAYLRFE